uniref:Uncharacterized protein n=1 Tax=Arundo donax TaxID=35708 RepID=A0A0A9DSR7_ARUDO
MPTAGTASARHDHGVKVTSTLRPREQHDHTTTMESGHPGPLAYGGYTPLQAIPHRLQPICHVLEACVRDLSCPDKEENFCCK